MALSVAHQNKVLDALFGSGSPATYYLGLLLANPLQEDGSLVSTEPSGGNYGRVAVTNNATNFPAATLGSKPLDITVTWPNPTSDWGTVRYLGVFSAASAGDLHVYSLFATPRLVSTGRAPAIAAGAASFKYGSLEG